MPSQSDSVVSKKTFVVVKTAEVVEGDVELSNSQLVADVDKYWSKQGGVWVQDESAPAWLIGAPNDPAALQYLSWHLIQCYWTVTIDENTDAILIVSPPGDADGMKMHLSVVNAEF